MSTDTAPHTYSPEDLAWFAAHYADAEWMVHVTGMDDCHLHANPDLDDDDPANPLLTEASAVQLAKDFNGFNEYYAQRFPGQESPGITATVFRLGVPFEPAAAVDVSA